MQREFSTAVQLEMSDLKAKVLRLTEQGTELDGKLTFLASMSEQVDLIEQQIIKWRYRLPDLTDDNNRERVVTAVEAQEDLCEFKDIAMRKIRELATTLTALEGEVRLFEQDREESWEAVSHKVSTLVDDSVLYENQKSQERQLIGLRSFAQHVEQFLDQLGGGSTAPGESRRVPRLEGVRPNMPQGNVAGASASSSTRPPSYLQTPKTTNCPSASSPS